MKFSDCPAALGAVSPDVEAAWKQSPEGHFNRPWKKDLDISDVVQSFVDEDASEGLVPNHSRFWNVYHPTKQKQMMGPTLQEADAALLLIQSWQPFWTLSAFLRP